MAAFFFNNYSSSGLNDISTLDLPLDPNSRHSTSCPSLAVSPFHINTNDSSSTNNTMSDSNKAKTATSGGFGSRIPKINFGFRRPTKNGTTTTSTATVTGGDSEYSSRSERSTPEGCEGNPPIGHIGGMKLASSSPRSSNSTVGRSKSLRLPRSNYVAKFAMHSKVDSVRDEAEDFYPDDLIDSASQLDDFEPQPPRNNSSKTGQMGLARSGRARSSTITAASSNSSSRESSPGGLTMSAGSSGSSTTNGARELDRSKFGYYGGGSLSQSDSPDVYQDLSSQPSFSRRSQSFSVKHQTRLRAGSFGAHNRLQPPQSGGGSANQPSRRSKTPTPLSQRTSQTGLTGMRNGSSKLALSRTSSLGKVKQQATGIVHESPSNTQSASQSRYQAKSQLSRRSSGEQRGKRPSSVVITENAADLNAIAHELSQGDPDSSQLEVKTIAGGRTRPTSAKTLSATSLNTRRSHSSIGYSTRAYQRSDTPDQQNTTPLSSCASSVTKSKFLSAGDRSSSIDKPNRPTSARDYYQHGRKDGKESHTAANEMSDSLLEGQLERAHSVTTFGGNSNDVTGGTLTSASGHVRRQSSGGGRGSAPSSGRSTPVHRSTSGSRLGKDAPDGGAVSSTSKVSAGLPPRTPYRVARTKATPTSGPTGINELEGSVLLEADDYRRISNDVKSLKTALLKLKRELQVDLEGKSPSSQTPQAPRSNTATPVKVGRSITSPGVTPGPAHSDLRKKLKAITSERDKALEEVSSCKKDLKVKSEKITTLMAELEKERKKNAELADELSLVEGHRNRLLDKVERLHADKHNLEARLNTLERASIYEQTFSESWLDELDGGDCGDLDIMDPSLGAEGTTSKAMTVERKEMTESEIGDSLQSDGGEGESSEPESAAVCSAPVS